MPPQRILMYVLLCVHNKDQSIDQS